MTTAVIYSNGSQECDRISALLESLPHVKTFHRYEVNQHFEQHQFEMEFGGDATYPQVSYGNKHIGNMHDTLQFLKREGMLETP